MQNIIIWLIVDNKDERKYYRYGYPDKDYLRRVKEELRLKGIV